MSRLVAYSRLKTLYQGCPLWLQELYARIPFHWRAGSIYRTTRQLIAKTDYLSKAELDRLQFDRMATLLEHASEHVPFYRTAIRKLAIDPRADSLADDFRKLPLIAKSDLQQTPQEFMATGGIGEPVYHDNTGGSSGTPFSFLKPNSMYPIELAYMLAQWERVGYWPGARKVTLRGRAFARQRPAQRWAYNPIYNELVLSSFHLDADTVTESLRQVRRFRPQFMHGYPSAIVTFLQTIQQAGLEMPSGIRAVLCGSEAVYDHQREYIATMLGCRVFSWYGQSECVLLAGECEHSRDYHIFPLYGLLELVDEHGQVIESAGIEGEIVATGLHNRAMPFIRYRVGDRGVLSGGPCPCGRNHVRLNRVCGRSQDYVYTGRGVRIPVTAFVFGQHFAAFRRIRAMQLVQQEPGELTIRLVCDRAYTESDEEEIRSKMQASVDQDLGIRFEYMERLPVNNAGKTPFVIQEVDV